MGQTEILSFYRDVQPGSLRQDVRRKRGDKWRTEIGFPSAIVILLTVLCLCEKLWQYTARAPPLNIQFHVTFVSFPKRGQFFKRILLTITSRSKKTRTLYLRIFEYRTSIDVCNNARIVGIPLSPHKGSCVRGSTEYQQSSLSEDTQICPLFVTEEFSYIGFRGFTAMSVKTVIAKVVQPCECRNFEGTCCSSFQVGNS